MIRVKEICKQKGISQAELGKKIGVSACGLNQSIVDNRSLDKLKHIANALEVTISELVGDQKEEENTIICPKCGSKFKLIE